MTEDELQEVLFYTTPITCLEEGYRDKVYLDSKGYPTIGYGWCICNKKHTKEDLKYFNMVMYEEAARITVEKHGEHLYNKLMMHPWFYNLSTERKAILIICAYQTGYNNLLKFHNMIAALEKKDFVGAAHEMLDSHVAKYTAPSRWARAAEIMRKDNFICIELYHKELANR